MKNNKKILIIVCVVIVILVATISIILLTKNQNVSKDFNKITSFEYYSGSSSLSIKFTGNKNNELFNVDFVEFNSGDQNIDSFTITLNELKDLLSNTKIENCKKQTYEYQCGDSDGCSHSSLSVIFEDEGNSVCYEINNEISTYFNNLSKTSIDE